MGRFLLSLLVSTLAVLSFTLTWFPRWVSLVTFPLAVWIAGVLSRNLSRERRPIFVLWSVVGAILMHYIVVSLIYVGFFGLCLELDAVCD